MYVWCSHADSVSLSSFELKFRADGRRVWADSLLEKRMQRGLEIAVTLW